MDMIPVPTSQSCQEAWMSQDYMCEQGEESSACIDSDATEGFPFAIIIILVTL